MHFLEKSLLSQRYFLRLGMPGTLDASSYSLLSADTNHSSNSFFEWSRSVCKRLTASVLIISRSFSNALSARNAGSKFFFYLEIGNG